MKEVELYVDTINDFEYSDYVAMCNAQGREIHTQRSQDYYNWNHDMKILVFGLFLKRMTKDGKQAEMVEVRCRNEKPQNVILHEFVSDKLKEADKVRFVRMAEPDKLSLTIVDMNGKQKTYKMTFANKDVTYDGIF